MKREHQKSQSARKLALNKQTIRELKPGELEQSAGGALISGVSIDQICYC
jgi:hypothetical protein